MAKKKKTVKVHKAPASPKAKGLQDQLNAVGSKATFECLESTARQNFLEVRSRSFRGIDILVKHNRELLDSGFVLLVDSDGKPTPESHAKLQEQAQLLMTANFKPKSEPKPDLGWGEARWSVSAAARKAGLDPTLGFEIGFTVARRPNADRAARMAELVESRFEIDGISMIPNSDGQHLDIPAGAMLSHKGLVIVRRGKYVLELTSIINALLKTGVKEWAKPTQAEKAESARKAKAEAKAKAKAKAAAEAFDVFDTVMAEAEKAREETERLESERLESERQARLAAEWTDVVTTRPDLVAAWEEARVEAQAAYDHISSEVSMIFGLVRAGKPAKEAVGKLFSDYPVEVFNKVAQWVKDTHAERTELSLAECTAMFVEFSNPTENGLEDLWPVFDWLQEDGQAMSPLEPIESYSTRDEWLWQVTYHPGLSYDTTNKLKEVANSTISTRYLLAPSEAVLS